jgi:hypothetical protein
MYKNRTILSIGIIILFMGMYASPVLAKESKECYTVTYAFLDENGVVQQCQLSKEESRKLDNSILQLLEDIKETRSYSECRDILKNFILRPGTHPFLRLILRLFFYRMLFQKDLDMLGPLNKKSFVASWGYTGGFLPLKQNQMKLFKPITFWYYSGAPTMLPDSVTIIIDPLPFDVETIYGSQFGMMRRFIGLYMYRQNPITEGGYTFFLGHVANIKGFGLPLFT